MVILVNPCKRSYVFGRRYSSDFPIVSFYISIFYNWKCQRFQKRTRRPFSIHKRGVFPLKSLKIAPKRQNLPLFPPFKSLFGGLSCPQKGSFRGDFTFLRHAQTYPQYGNLGCRLPKNDPTRTLPHFLIPAKARRTHLSIFLVSSSKKSPLRPSFSSLLSFSSLPHIDLFPLYSSFPLLHSPPCHPLSQFLFLFTI